MILKMRRQGCESAKDEPQQEAPIMLELQRPMEEGELKNLHGWG